MIYAGLIVCLWIMMTISARCTVRGKQMSCVLHNKYCSQAKRYFWICTTHNGVNPALKRHLRTRFLHEAPSGVRQLQARQSTVEYQVRMKRTGQISLFTLPAAYNDRRTGFAGTQSGLCWGCCNHSNTFVLWSPLSWQIWRFYLSLYRCLLQAEEITLRTPNAIQTMTVKY